ncbi:MAG: trypsin-like peptidase domain-containing protein [Planctomycetota bacterium]
MSFQNLPAKERLHRIRAYLESISPSHQLESAKVRLESATGAGDSGEELEVMRGGEEANEALETLDVMIRDGDSADVTPGGLDALEAVIHKKERPAVNIINDTFSQPPAPWQEFGIGEAKRRLENVIPSIGRIEVPNDLRGRPYAGTGFVVGDDLLMTNRHVARIFANGLGTRHLRFEQNAAIDFKREIPMPGAPDPTLLTITDILMVHPWWDMALLRVAGLPEKHPKLALSVKRPEELSGRNAAVIGYPAQDDRSNLDVQNRIFGGVFEVKRLLPGKVVGRGETESYGKRVGALTHDCSTLGGNSGSAVIDAESGEVVALHFAGEYLKQNYAVPMADLAEDNQVTDAGVNFVGRVEPRNDFYGKVWSEVSTETIADNVREPNIHDLSKSQIGTPEIQRTDTCASWAIPIHVSVSIGNPTSATIGTPDMRAAKQEPITSDEGFSSRHSTAGDFTERFSLPSLTKTGFDWAAALSTALGSHLAYDEKSEVESTARNLWEFETCEFIRADNTECFVAATEDVVLVGFRGTEFFSVADWLTDLNALSTSQPYGRVHRGFLAGFRLVDSQLRSLMDSLTGRPVVLTGHSLGGALATIAAAEWHGQYRISSIYTYGQPGVGKRSFHSFIQKHYANRFFRFVNDDDIVPKVPPTYRHVGRLFHFGPSGSLMDGRESIGNEVAVPTESPMLTEAQFHQLRAELLEERVRRLQGVPASSEEGLLPSFRDHKLDLYIERVASKAE